MRRNACALQYGVRRVYYEYAPLARDSSHGPRARMTLANAYNAFRIFRRITATCELWFYGTFSSFECRMPRRMQVFFILNRTSFRESLAVECIPSESKNNIQIVCAIIKAVIMFTTVGIISKFKIYVENIKIKLWENICLRILDSKKCYKNMCLECVLHILRK